MVLELVVRRRNVAFALERHRQQSRRLVDHHQLIVFIENMQITKTRSGGQPRRAAGTIHPDSNDITGGQRRSRLSGSSFQTIEKHLAALDRRESAPSRTEPIGGGKKLIEPEPDLPAVDSPLPLSHASLAAPARPKCVRSFSRRFGRSFVSTA